MFDTNISVVCSISTSVFAIVSTLHKYSLSHLAVQGLLLSRTHMHIAIMADTMLHTCIPSKSDRSVDETPVARCVCCHCKNCPLRVVGGDCFHCKVCFQCCNQSLTACTSCGTLTCGDCIEFMKTAPKNNEDGHRCPTCEDRALRRHVVHQLFRMKQSADDGVCDPSLITLLESLPKDNEADQNDKAPQGKKARGEKTTPLKTAKGDDSTPAKTTGKKKKAKKKGGAKKAASKKRKGADDGSDDDTGSESWPSSSEPDETYRAPWVLL